MWYPRPWKTIQQILTNTEELLSLMSTNNVTISKLDTDFNSLATALTAFIAAVKAYIAAQSSGTNISAADQQTLNDIDQKADAALAAIQAIQVPAVNPTPSA